MIKGEVFAKYRHLSPEERRKFDRWLQANAIIGSIFAVGLLAMALASLRAPEPTAAVAKSGESGEFSGQTRHREPSKEISPHELTIRRAPEQLPVQKFDAF